MNIVKNLSNDQKKALLAIINGENVFVSGSGGTGKSTLIRGVEAVYKKKFPDKVLNLTSTTGISAINVGGMTIHSFAGIGFGTANISLLIRKIRSKPDIVKRWKDTDLLIIDEVSMLSCDVFDKLNEIAKVIRGNDKPFGGLQLLLFGDFYQLTPIIDKKFSQTNKVFCFESDKWFDIINVHINLKKVFRQTDTEYISMLSRLRRGRPTQDDIKLIQSRVKTRSEIKQIINDTNGQIIKLYPINRMVQAENDKCMRKLPGNPRIFNAYYEGDKHLIMELETQMKSIGYHAINLKIGARVMLTSNINTREGLVNGLIGTIQSFSGDCPIVKFDNGIVQKIERIDREIQRQDRVPVFDDPLDNTIDDGSDIDKLSDPNYVPKQTKYRVINLTGKCKQIPLVLAYAISIHKSQGQTIEKAIISLEECFTEHQVYVALSRVKNLDGVYLTSFDPRKIRVNKKVKKFYRNLN